MSQDETPKKRKGGPPAGKGNGTQLIAKRRRQHSFSLMERIRERVDPDILIDFHIAILQGTNPVLQPKGDSWVVLPDPNTHAVAPTLEQKAQSAKWLTERGHGLPVQSIQVDAEFRARIDQIGSGVPSHELESMNLEMLFKLKEMFQLTSGHNDAIDAEFTEVKASVEPVSDTSNTTSDNTSTNSPLPSDGSEQ